MASNLERAKGLIGQLSFTDLKDIHAHATKELEKRSFFRFLDLPAEMRNHIYYLAADSHLRDHPLGDSKTHGLLCVSTQTRLEFMSIYYSNEVVNVKFLPPCEDASVEPWRYLTGRKHLKAIMDDGGGVSVGEFQMDYYEVAQLEGETALSVENTFRWGDDPHRGWIMEGLIQLTSDEDLVSWFELDQPVWEKMGIEWEPPKK